MKIEIDDDQVYKVVSAEMVRHSRHLERCISDLKRKRRRKPLEQDDLDRYKEVLAAMKVIIGYYGPPA